MEAPAGWRAEESPAIVHLIELVPGVTRIFLLVQIHCVRTVELVTPTKADASAGNHVYRN